MEYTSLENLLEEMHVLEYLPGFAKPRNWQLYITNAVTCCNSGFVHTHCLG